jgi:hypothetical protein
MIERLQLNPCHLVKAGEENLPAHWNPGIVPPAAARFPCRETNDTIIFVMNYRGDDHEAWRD